MHGIILCSLILFVVICYSNGAPVETQIAAKKGTRVVGASAVGASVAKRLQIAPYTNSSASTKSSIDTHPKPKRRRHRHKRRHKLHRHRHKLYPLKDRMKNFVGGSTAYMRSQNTKSPHPDFEMTNGEIYEHGGVPDLKRRTDLDLGSNRYISGDKVLDKGYKRADLFVHRHDKGSKGKSIIFGDVYRDQRKNLNNMGELILFEKKSSDQVPLAEDVVKSYLDSVPSPIYGVEYTPSQADGDEYTPSQVDGDEYTLDNKKTNYNKVYNEIKEFLRNNYYNDGGQYFSPNKHDEIVQYLKTRVDGMQDFVSHGYTANTTNSSLPNFRIPSHPTNHSSDLFPAAGGAIKTNDDCVQLNKSTSKEAGVMGWCRNHNLTENLGLLNKSLSLGDAKETMSNLHYFIKNLDFLTASGSLGRIIDNDTLVNLHKFITYLVTFLDTSVKPSSPGLDIKNMTFHNASESIISTNNEQNGKNTSVVTKSNLTSSSLVDELSHKVKEESIGKSSSLYPINDTPLLPHYTNAEVIGENGLTHQGDEKTKEKEKNLKNLGFEEINFATNNIERVKENDAGNPAFNDIAIKPYHLKKKKNHSGRLEFDEYHHKENVGNKDSEFNDVEDIPPTIEDKLPYYDFDKQSYGTTDGVKNMTNDEINFLSSVTDNNLDAMVPKEDNNLDTMVPKEDFDERQGYEYQTEDERQNHLTDMAMDELNYKHENRMYGKTDDIWTGGGSNLYQFMRGNATEEAARKRFKNQTSDRTIKPKKPKRFVDPELLKKLHYVVLRCLAIDGDNSNPLGNELKRRYHKINLLNKLNQGSYNDVVNRVHTVVRSIILPCQKMKHQSNISSFHNDSSDGVPKVKNSSRPLLSLHTMKNDGNRTLNPSEFITHTSVVNIEDMATKGNPEDDALSEWIDAAKQFSKYHPDISDGIESHESREQSGIGDRRTTKLNESFEEHATPEKENRPLPVSQHPKKEDKKKRNKQVHVEHLSSPNSVFEMSEELYPDSSSEERSNHIIIQTEGSNNQENISQNVEKIHAKSHKKGTRRHMKSKSITTHSKAVKKPHKTKKNLAKKRNHLKNHRHKIMPDTSRSRKRTHHKEHKNANQNNRPNTRLYHGKLHDDKDEVVKDLWYGYGIDEYNTDKIDTGGADQRIVEGDGDENTDDGTVHSGKYISTAPQSKRNRKKFHKNRNHRRKKVKSMKKHVKSAEEAYAEINDIADVSQHRLGSRKGNNNPIAYNPTQAAENEFIKANSGLGAVYNEVQFAKKGDAGDIGPVILDTQKESTNDVNVDFGIKEYKGNIGMRDDTIDKQNMDYATEDEANKQIFKQIMKFGNDYDAINREIMKFGIEDDPVNKQIINKPKIKSPASHHTRKSKRPLIMNKRKGNNMAVHAHPASKNLVMHKQKAKPAAYFNEDRIFEDQDPGPVMKNELDTEIAHHNNENLDSNFQTDSHNSHIYKTKNNNVRNAFTANPSLTHPAFREAPKPKFYNLTDFLEHQTNNEVDELNREFNNNPIKKEMFNSEQYNPKENIADRDIFAAPVIPKHPSLTTKASSRSHQEQTYHPNKIHEYTSDTAVGGLDMGNSQHMDVQKTVMDSTHNSVHLYMGGPSVNYYSGNNNVDINNLPDLDERKPLDETKEPLRNYLENQSFNNPQTNMMQNEHQEDGAEGLIGHSEVKGMDQQNTYMPGPIRDTNEGSLSTQPVFPPESTSPVSSSKEDSKSDMIAGSMLVSMDSKNNVNADVNEDQS